MNCASKNGSGSSLNSGDIQDLYAVVKTHSKSQSADTVRKSRSGSGSKTRSSRSGTVSSQPFQPSQLSHSHNPTNQRQKPKKTVRFDPVTTLIYLCQHGDSSESCLNKVNECIDLIKTLENDNIDINNVYTPQQWLTPLHIACSHGKMEIARALLESGAAVNIEDKEKWTPLHCAAAEGHINMIQLLGACQGNFADDDKSNSEWIYVLDGPINLVPLNEEGESPEDVALEAKIEDISKTLRGIFVLI
jgi:ankyrin repeat protein